MSAKQHDFTSLIFEIADTFDMELSRKTGESVGSLKGSESKELALVEGFDWIIKPTVVDSATYSGEEKAGALLHVCGSLYLLLLVDGVQNPSVAFSQMWVIDGAKMGWTKAHSFLIFPASWHRDLLYQNICDGVVASFARNRKKDAWTEMHCAKQQMVEYIARKKAEREELPKGMTRAQQLVEQIKCTSLTVSHVSDKYRTKGPRGV